MSQAPTSDFTIRPVQEADLPALEWGGEYTHFRRLFRSTFEEMRQGNRLMLVAEIEFQIVGQIFLQLQGASLSLFNGQRRGYLYALRVRGPWQRQGLGRQLIETAEAELMRRKIYRVRIAVAKNNPDARRLYERLNYKVISEDAGVWHYQDAEGTHVRVEEPSYILEKTLR
jgi:ribosomal protein S18 acetylase RimI-like enzyme